MQIIQELRDGNGAIYFERIYKSEQNRVLGKECIRFPTYTREQTDGYMAIIMYTKDMQPIVEAFVFLNQKNEPYSVRRQSASALRLLYSHETIISKKLRDFTVADIEAKQRIIDKLGSCTGEDIAWAKQHMTKIESSNHAFSE